jgi:hypothetical protein
MKRSSGSSTCSALRRGEGNRRGKGSQRAELARFVDVGWLEAVAYPKIRSGCAMKSVIRSSMLRGSSTKVGNVTLDRSIPTLQKSPIVEASGAGIEGIGAGCRLTLVGILGRR